MDALEPTSKDDRHDAASPRRGRGRPARDADPVVDDETLLDAAFEAFSEQGYEGAAVRELSRRMGVSHNLIRVRFGSKEDLWRRAVDSRMGTGTGTIWAAVEGDYPSEVDRLKALIIHFAEWSWLNHGWIALASLEGRRRTWRLSHIYEHHVAPFRDRLHHLLTRVADEQGRPRVSTAQFLALLIHGVGSYFALKPLTSLLEPKTRMDASSVRRHAEEFAALLVAPLTRLEAAAEVQTSASEG